MAVWETSGTDMLALIVNTNTHTHSFMTLVFEQTVKLIQVFHIDAMTEPSEIQSNIWKKPYPGAQ